MRGLLDVLELVVIATTASLLTFCARLLPNAQQQRVTKAIRSLLVDEILLLCSRNPQQRPERTPLGGLVRAADALPIPTRKAVKALAGDYMEEVRRLNDEGRPRMAKWNVYLAWGYAAWYVARSPFDWIVSLLIKNLRGSQ